MRGVGITHGWKFPNQKWVEYVGIMEEKMKNMGEEMANLNFKEENTRDFLHKENKDMKAML